MQRPELRKSENIFNRVMVKDNIAIVTLLEHVDTGDRLVVANAHLHWDPAFCDVKLIQTALMLEEIESLLVKWNRKYALTEAYTAQIPAIVEAIPLLICGDFNSLPDSGVVELMSAGHVEADHRDLLSYDYDPLTDKGLNHKLQLMSAYQHISDMDFTNFTPTFKGVIDYIWHNTSTLGVTGLLSKVDKKYALNCVGFPNAHHPSDHIPIVVSLRLKHQSLQNGKKVSFNNSNNRN